MKFPPYFIVIVFTCIITAIIFSITDNDLIDESQNSNQVLSNDINFIKNLKQIKDNINEKKKEEEEILKQIKEKEKELKEKDEERRKKIEQQLKEIEEIEKKERLKNQKEEEMRQKQEERRRVAIKERQRRDEAEMMRKKMEEKNKEKQNEKINSDKIKIQDSEKTKKEKKTIEEVVKNKIRIACAYATDNAYVYPTLVAMTSLAENAGKSTFYDIYVMINPEFTMEHKNVLKSVENKHPEHCQVIFIDMGNKFKDEKTNTKITTPAYYRLELHNLLPNVDRVIWMDGDTAVFEDLTELITLDMKGNYIMGFLDSIPEAIERFNIKNATVLCSGVLLMDLNALRENNMTEKFTKFMIEEKEKINQHDQTVINVVCQGKIAPLPPKYGIWSFEAEKYALKHNERQRPHLRYNKDEFVKAYYHPAILHYVWPKPFWKRKRPIFNKEWWNYAKISGYYNEVYNKSPKFTKRILSEKRKGFYRYPQLFDNKKRNYNYLSH